MDDQPKVSWKLQELRALRHVWVPLAECGGLADGDYIGKHNLTTSEVSLTRSKLRGGHWEGFAPDEILSPSLGPIPEVSR